MSPPQTDAAIPTLGPDSQSQILAFDRFKDVLMLLPLEDAKHFFKLHNSLMCFVNERLQVVPDVLKPEQYPKVPAPTRWKLRTAFLSEPGLIRQFVDANPFDLSTEELGIISQWQHYVAGKFFIVRYLKKHAVFLIAKPPTAYGVVALSDPFERLLGPQLPVLVETMLLPFKGQIIYDGLMGSCEVSTKPGIRHALDELYKAAKEGLGVVTTLPAQSGPPETSAKPQRTKPKASQPTSNDPKEVLQVVVGILQEFCRANLNEEYSVLACKMAEKLARKKPSPLLSGRPNTWAAAILRTVGWVNFLDDPSQTPHMKMKAIDQALGTSESTSQQKSKLIRKWFRINPFAPEWTLPALMDDNPRIWMFEIDGLIMDIRQCSRAVQEIAFAKGLIPYLPADRESNERRTGDSESM